MQAAQESRSLHYKPHWFWAVVRYSLHIQRLSIPNKIIQHKQFVWNFALGRIANFVPGLFFRENYPPLKGTPCMAVFHEAQWLTSWLMVG